MNGDEIYIVRNGRLFKVIDSDNVEEMIAVVQNPSSLPDSAYGFYTDCVHGVSTKERARLKRIIEQNPNYDRRKKLSIRSVVRQ